MRVAIASGGFDGGSGDPNGAPTGKAFGLSLLTHGAVVAAIVLSGVIHLKTDTWGGEKTSTGAVGVAMVKTIPLPQKQAPPNPLANNTKSNVPQAPPEKMQPKLQVKAPVEKAIPLAKKDEKRKPAVMPREQTLYRPPSEYKTNQVYSKTPQAVSSPMYGIQGAGGIDVGPATVLGNRFGAYVTLMRDRIAQAWNKGDVRSRPAEKVAISFTIARNGAVSNVQVSKPSGNYLLDNSAKRAVIDANPLPPLPTQFERNEATVELWFQLQP